MMEELIEKARDNEKSQAGVLLDTLEFLHLSGHGVKIFCGV